MQLQNDTANMITGSEFCSFMFDYNFIAVKGILPEDIIELLAIEDVEYAGLLEADENYIPFNFSDFKFGKDREYWDVVISDEINGWVYMLCGHQDEVRHKNLLDCLSADARVEEANYYIWDGHCDYACWILSKNGHSYREFSYSMWHIITDIGETLTDRERDFIRRTEKHEHDSLFVHDVYFDLIKAMGDHFSIQNILQLPDSFITGYYKTPKA